MLNILHICSDYSNQKLYKNLLLNLSKFNVKQTMFVPTRTERELNKNNITDNKNIQVIYRFILKKYHRIFFNLKIKEVSRALLYAVDVKTIDIVHAHFLFSDGAVALKLFKKYGIPYIVSVRNTDVNMFFKYRVDLRSRGVEIMKNAQQVIFLNEPYKTYTVNTYVKNSLKNIIRNKSIVIPNGMNEFWFNNKTLSLKNIHQTNIIYVGNFTTNKNIHSSFEAINQLVKKGDNIRFTLVGDGGDGEEEVMKIVENNKDIVFHHKRTANKNDLLAYYRAADLFLMPSIKETFGIVYIEAMSQGLPIIYTKGQGIDGYFKHNYPGYSVDPLNIDDIKEKIKLVIEQKEELSNNALSHIERFSWEIISKTYYNIYKNIN